MRRDGIQSDRLCECSSLPPRSDPAFARLSDRSSSTRKIASTLAIGVCHTETRFNLKTQNGDPDRTEDGRAEEIFLIVGRESMERRKVGRISPFALDK